MTHDANGPARRNGPADRRSFCDYLREGRAASAMSLEEIARVTRIPHRSLERLEEGAFEALPADVFVRGFLRSYAQCVGLDAEETVRRYAACGLAPAPVVHPEGVRSRDESRNARREPAVLRAQHTPAPELKAKVAQERAVETKTVAATETETVTATETATVAATETEVATETATAPVAESKTKATRKGKRRGKRRKKGGRKVEAKSSKVEEANAESAVEAKAEPDVDANAETTPVAKSRVVNPPRPVQLVIDDEYPDSAAEIQAVRADAEQQERDASRRSFLPPALLDTEDGSRRGALTLAVIILVIVATLTMSYLLRHPSSSGSGVTELGAPEPPSLQA